MRIFLGIIVLAFAVTIGNPVVHSPVRVGEALVLEVEVRFAPETPVFEEVR